MTAFQGLQDNRATNTALSRRPWSQPVYYEIKVFIFIIITNIALVTITTVMSLLLKLYYYHNYYYYQFDHYHHNFTRARVCVYVCIYVHTNFHTNIHSHALFSISIKQIITVRIMPKVLATSDIHTRCSDIILKSDESPRKMDNSTVKV